MVDDLDPIEAGLIEADPLVQIERKQHWDLLRSSGILPTLQTLAKLPPMNDGAGRS